MAPELRLGLIGCGRVAGERHLPALRRVAGFRIVAVADTDAARLAPFDAAQRHTDYRALLSRTDVDVVGILTPTASHAEITLAALAAGKHVLVEKPLALNAAECDRMIECAAVTPPVKVVVGLNLRWHRLVRRARALVASGTLGRVTAIRSVFTHERTGENAPDWHRNRATGGGVLLNESIHHFDLWRYMLGADVVGVFATTKGSSRHEDDTSTVTATLTGDIQASGVFAFRTAPNSEIEIYGENGRLYLNCYRFDGLQFYPRTSFPGNAGIRLRNLLTALPGGGGFTESFRGLWKHFRDCIRNDEPSECTLQDGKRATEIAAACVMSACKGRPVQV